MSEEIIYGPITMYIIDLLNKWLGLTGISSGNINIIRTAILFVALSLFVLVLWWLTKKILINVLHVFVNKSKTKWDDYLLKHKFFSVVSNLVPLIFMDSFLLTIFYSYARIGDFFIKVTDVVIVLVIAIAIMRFLSAANEVLSEKESLKDKPIKAYFQLGKIIIGGFMIIIGLSIATEIEKLTFLTSLGASTAVLLLVFKDTILGFVGSIQLSANDMVRLGDWITMERYGADGDVTEINLTTVKVQNFDKTITTIPTYSFISDSFKNWRGMEMSGGRRIKRALNIEINSINFCDETLMDNMKKIDILNEYINTKEDELKNHNQRLQTESGILLNGRKQTNIGLYRAYILAYLKQNEHINQEMTLMVRQLPPTVNGVPIEIYCFTKTKDWGVYEGVIADVFDHLFSATNYFGLEVFERPSGSDITQVLKDN